MSGFFDDLNDLFKSDKQKENERKKEIKDALNGEKDLVELLKQLEKRYKDSLKPETPPNFDELFPEDSGLKETEYNPVSDEEIEKTAGDEIAFKKDADKNKIDGKTDSEIDKLKDDGGKAKDYLDKTNTEIEESYSKNVENAEQKGIKNGISRGSIVVGQLKNLADGKEISEGEAMNAYNSVIGMIDGEIERLNKDRTSALDGLNLKYAAELENRISDLKEERADAILKNEKFNNSVREKNIKYAQDRQKNIDAFKKKYEAGKTEKEKALKEHEAIYGYSGEKRDNYAERYNLALDFYLSLSPDIASQALEASPNMKYYLGNHYDDLMKTLKDRNAPKRNY